MILEQSNESSNMPARKSHSKECTARTFAVVERVQMLISDDPEQTKIASMLVYASQQCVKLPRKTFDTIRTYIRIH